MSNILGGMEIIPQVSNHNDKEENHQDVLSQGRCNS